jgi:exo-beta-1,3-glucanase (GH17 family)
MTSVRMIAATALIFIVRTALAVVSAPSSLTVGATPDGVVLSWNAVAEADHHDVLRRGVAGSFATIGTAATNRYVDATAASLATYAYAVRAVDDAGGSSDLSVAAVASTTSFDDDPPIPQLTLVRAVHAAQLRSSIDQFRALAGLGAMNWGESIAAGGPVRAAHITEMRSALDAARSALALPALSYANTLTVGTTPIRAIDVIELRTRAVGRAGGRDDVFWTSVSGLTNVQSLLAVTPTLYAGTTSGLFRSTDGGATFSAVNGGLTNTNVASLAVADDGTLFAGTRGGGVFESVNGGDTWTLRSATPANATSLVTTAAGTFAADGTNCSGISLLPAGGGSAVDRTGIVAGCPAALAAGNGYLFAGTSTTGIYRSTNEGLSWSTIGAAVTSANIHALAVDRDGRMFAATHTAGVWRSVDHGTTFIRVQNGLVPAELWALSAESSGDLLAGSATVHRSADNGDSWSVAGSGLMAAQAVTALCATSRYRFAVADGRLFRTSTGFHLYGINFSPYIGAQSPDLGSNISEGQLIARMQIVRPWTRWIRAFGMTHGLEKAGRVAHGLGLKAALGAWIGTDLAANETELASLVAAARNGDADLLVVGSEVLLRGDVSEAALLEYMQRVRQLVPGIPVATADVYGTLLDHPNVIAACDVVLPNYYPYWQGIAVGNAIAAVHGWHEQIVAAAGGKPVIVSESGWPSAGNTVGSAVPSPENASSYFLDFLSWTRATRVASFYFEAFDEPWKYRPDMPQEAHWGVWNNDGTLKSGFDSSLDGETTSDHWSGQAVPGGPGTAQLLFTSVPPYGSTADLNGREWHVKPADYRVAVYIYVGGWWTKPTFVSPTTPIYPDGTWVCDVTTGGNDVNATKIAAFLIPATYTPPAMSGGQSLPAELYANAGASVEVTRSP